MSREQLQGIFTGTITNWKEVGGPDLNIDVFVVNKQSATRNVFAGWVFAEGQDYAGDRIETIRPDIGVLGKVSDNPGAIGH